MIGGRIGGQSTRPGLSRTPSRAGAGYARSGADRLARPADSGVGSGRRWRGRVTSGPADLVVDDAGPAPPSLHMPVRLCICSSGAKWPTTSRLRTSSCCWKALPPTTDKPWSTARDAGLTCGGQHGVLAGGPPVGNDYRWATSTQKAARLTCSRSPDTALDARGARPREALPALRRSVGYCFGIVVRFRGRARP